MLFKLDLNVQNDTTMINKTLILLVLIYSGFVANAQVPSISSFSPTVATIGYTVVIKGNGFTGATAVSFGGVAAASFTVIDDATINAILGTGISGNVSVTTPKGNSILAGFSYCTGVMPSVSITASQASIVSNTSVTFTATATNGGRSPSYKWYKNGLTVNGATSSTYTLTTLASSDSIWVLLKSNAACTIVDSAFSSKIFMYVSDKIITTVAGNGTANWSGDGGAATAATLNGPTGIAFDKAGNLYIAERNNHDIRKVTPSGIISTFAGNGNAVYGGDGGAAVYASLNGPTGLAFDKDNNLYIADKGNNRVRKVDANGIITTVAGNGQSTKTGNGSLATAASIGYPESIAFDANGNLFIADYNDAGNNAFLTMRKVDKNGKIASVIENISTDYNNTFAIDSLGNLYYFDYTTSYDSTNYNYATYLKKLNTIGAKAILAGSYSQKYSYNSDGISALLLYIGSSHKGLSLDKSGNIYFVENSSIRKIGTNGVINYVVGHSSYCCGSASDGNYALNFNLRNPYATAFDAAGNLYISEEGANRIRKVADGTPFSTSLPLNITAFSANAINQNINTDWQTASEQNTDYFIIQHSTDGVSFTDIGTLKAIGSGANNYTFTDKNPNNGINYYRLQCIDRDGSRSYSKVVSVQLGSAKYFSISPNPASDFVLIHFSKINEKGTLAVYDITGKAVITQTLLGNSTTFKLNTQTLTNGFYVLRVNTSTASYNEKLIIQK